MGEDRKGPSARPETLIKPEQLVGKKVGPHAYVFPDQRTAPPCGGSYKPFANEKSINWDSEWGYFTATCGTNYNNESVPCQQDLMFDPEIGQWVARNPFKYAGKHI